MSRLTFHPLDEILQDQVIALMNDEMVGKQLPLLAGGFSEQDYHHFIAAKQALWDNHGYGPWAFCIDGQFAGWGGLQPEQGEADFALVLHPDFWGWGRRIFQRILDQAFEEMKLDSVTILLPPSRPNSKAVKRFGFKEDGVVEVAGEGFERYRLTADQG